MKFFRWSGIVTLLMALAAPGARSDDGMWTLTICRSNSSRRSTGLFRPGSGWIMSGCPAFGSETAGPDRLSAPTVSSLRITTSREDRSRSSPRRKRPDSQRVLCERRESELKCPDLEINVLVGMDNVTAEVMGTVKTGMTPAQALDAAKHPWRRSPGEASREPDFDRIS